MQWSGCKQDAAKHQNTGAPLWKSSVEIEGVIIRDMGTLIDFDKRGPAIQYRGHVIQYRGHAIQYRRHAIQFRGRAIETLDIGQNSKRGLAYLDKAWPSKGCPRVEKLTRIELAVCLRA